MTSSWILSFSYQDDARSNTHQICTVCTDELSPQSTAVVSCLPVSKTCEVTWKYKCSFERANVFWTQYNAHGPNLCGTPAAATPCRQRQCTQPGTSASRWSSHHSSSLTRRDETRLTTGSSRIVPVKIYSETLNITIPTDWLTSNTTPPFYLQKSQKEFFWRSHSAVYHQYTL